MSEYSHKVGALYAAPEQASAARDELRRGGFSDAQLRILEPTDSETAEKLEPEGDAIPGEIIKDTLIGGGAGAGAGAAGATALGMAGATLFVSTPVMAALMITGYAATLGGTVGAVKGLHLERTVFDRVVADTVAAGHWALIVHCRDGEEERQAKNLLGEHVERLVTS